MYFLALIFLAIIILVFFIVMYVKYCSVIPYSSSTFARFFEKRVYSGSRKEIFFYNEKKMKRFVRLFIDADIKNAINHGYIFYLEYCDKTHAVIFQTPLFLSELGKYKNGVEKGNNPSSLKAPYYYIRYRMRHKNRLTHKIIVAR
jgi:hypothetical protein